MKQLITGAFILSAALLTAQDTKKTTDDNKPVTVRIKKVENINGVEKVTDTTYTVNGPLKLQELDKLTQKEGDEKKDGKARKVVVITDEVHGDDVKVVTSGEVMDEQVERAMKLASKDGKTVEQVMTVDVDVDTKEGANGEKKITKIVILKTAKIVEPTAEDAKMLNKQTGIGDNKLPVEEMKFYPNPNNGKFTLDFNLADKGNTEVSILNMEGKSIYKEELKDFSGNYKRDMDISSNPKGVYFVKISQGKHSQLKKIVLE